MADQVKNIDQEIETTVEELTSEDLAQVTGGAGTSGGGMGAGKVSMQDFHFSQRARALTL